jgi:hypothetical protein
LDKRLKQIQQLTSMMLDAELFELRKISNEQKAKKDEIDALSAAQDARNKQLAATTGLDAALQAGVDARWGRWRDKQARELNVARARLMAKMEQQRKSAQKAFGRDEAAKTLIKRSEADAAAKVKL